MAASSSSARFRHRLRGSAMLGGVQLSVSERRIDDGRGCLLSRFAARVFGGYFWAMPRILNSRPVRQNTLPSKVILRTPVYAPVSSTT